MAVNTKPPQLIRNYWPRLKSRSKFLVGFATLLSGGIVAALLLTLGGLSYTAPIFWLIVTVVLLTNSITGLAVFWYISRPTKDLLTAVVHITGEPTSAPLPNPNDKEYQENGFREALQAIYTLATHTDKPSTDEPSQEANLPTTSTDLATALEKTQAGFIAFNQEHHIVYANKAAPVATGENGVRTLVALFNGNDTLDAWLDECEQHAVHAEKVWTRIPDRTPDREGQRIFDIYASYEKGVQYEVVLTCVDRTVYYQQDEEDLNFIAFAAHELRGPITVIRGYLDVLQDELSETLQDDQVELFRRLVVSANRLTGYINNILNTSRYDRRHLKLYLVEDTVQDIYDMIRDDMELRASSQNRMMTVAFPPDLPTIAADRASLSEVLGNLIDNAIKYSNEGGLIEVTAEPHGDFVDIKVVDHGIGMPGNVVGNLFQKFYRSHRSRETVAGTGIGLYISKAIVESHGGTISVRSEEGEGSTFIVSLPIYATVASTLQSENNTNEGLIKSRSGWIKNHSMYRG